MKISKEKEAQILRYYHVEKWRIGTIARQLHVHHSVVRRVLSQAGISKEIFSRRASIITPYLSFITETLTKYPKLAASRLYEMVRQRGFAGSVDHFRHVISLHRPRPFAEAYLRLRTLPGEQAQVDWAHFGYIEIGKAKRPLMAFVMVLSYSRKIFLRFYLNQQTANFLRGHEAAFNEWKGLPRICLYDNLKSAVLERHGDAIRFNPILLEFAAHYRYEPRPVAVARGNEKGRVERAIRYVRDNFFAARTWKNINDLNNQASGWCNGIASDRPCPEDKAMSVREAFILEQPKLLALPQNPCRSHEREEVNVGKTPYVRFDLNDYSVPHQYVRRVVTVFATLEQVSIVDGMANLIAEHKRSYEKGAQIEDASHINELIDYKKRAKENRGKDRLMQAVPNSKMLFVKAAERGYSLGMITAQFLKLLDCYGAREMEIAINEALSKEVPHPNAVRIFLEKRRDDQHLEPPIVIDLPEDERVRGLFVSTHDLKSYDQLKFIKEEENNEQ